MLVTCVTLTRLAELKLASAEASIADSHAMVGASPSDLPERSLMVLICECDSAATNISALAGMASRFGFEQFYLLRG